MGVLGGRVGIRLLNYASKGGTTHAYPDVATAYATTSKVEVLFGSSIWDEFVGKRVLDFGCGVGTEAVEIAVRGARHVVGVELNRSDIAAATARAAARGVADKCSFGTDWHDPVDVIFSLDAFEHFSDPAGILRRMHALLKPGGSVIASFGPTWYHPLGGHFFSVLPYSHVVFSESALVQWRSLYKTDGARSFSDTGLNRMTIRRFEKLVAASPFRFASFEAVPIRRLRPIANRFTREFTTAVVRCKLLPRDAPG